MGAWLCRRHRIFILIVGCDAVILVCWLAVHLIMILALDNTCILPDVVSWLSNYSVMLCEISFQWISQW